MDNYVKIYIDPDESLKAFLDKIKMLTTNKVIVIVHSKSPIFIGQVNLELIKNYAEEFNKEIIFITNIQKIRNVLNKAGFKNYSTLKELKETKVEGSIVEKERKSLLTVDEYSNSRKKGKKKNIFKLAIVMGICFLLGIIWVYFAFPVVTVEVKPMLQEKVLVSQIKGLVSANKVDFTNKVLPLIKEEIVIKDDFKLETTGSKSIGIRAGQGVLTLINSRRKKITIPQDTIVSTRNGTKFRTINRVVVPSASVDKFMDVVVGIKAGRAEVNIEALEKGEKGNVSAGRIVNFVNKNYSVKIINPEPTYGGRDRLVKAVSKEDIDKGLVLARDNLLVKANLKLEDKFAKDLIFFKDNISITDPVFEVEQKVEEISDELLIKSKVKITGFAVGKENLKKLIFKLYKDSLDKKFVLDNPKIIIKGVEVELVRDKEVSFLVKSVGQIIAKLNKEDIINQILGKKVEEAKKILDNMLEIDKYQIKPTNQVNLPQFKYGINLVVEEDSAVSKREE